MAGQDFDSRLNSTNARHIRFAVAGKEDDAAIRRLLRDNPMHGAVSLSLEREPDYFRGMHLAGAKDETILGFSNERLVCMGRCSYRKCWINGEPRSVGYLGELRLDTSVKGRFDILRGGYRFFKKLHDGESDKLYFTSIAADNHRARRLLESGLRGLPRYDFLTEFVTLLIAVPRKPKLGGLQFEIGSPERIEDMVSTLNCSAGRHQLAAVWTEERLLALARKGLPLDRFHIVLDGDEVIACGALWDQRDFRQTVIRGYAPALSAMRPFIHVASRLLGTSHLPPKGSVLKHAFLSPLALTSGHESLLPDFVESFFSTAAQSGIEFLTLGLPASDARLPVLQKRFFTRSYHSRLYSVGWGGEAWRAWSSGEEAFIPEVALL